MHRMSVNLTGNSLSSQAAFPERYAVHGALGTSTILVRRSKALSAYVILTAVFGMGTGETPQPSSPIDNFSIQLLSF